MVLAVRRDARQRVAEFLTMPEAAPEGERWELIDGQAILMSPPSERHQQITANLVGRLGEIVQRQGCRALPGLGILNDFVDDYARFPDVVVRCGPLLPDGFARDPLLIAEVLSPSTMSRDRGYKAEFHRGLQTLRVYLIDYQDEERVEIFRRSGSKWSFHSAGIDGTIDLPELGASLPVSAIYAGLDT
ncbi:Uma2 family endonuclease [Methylobacterium durans]|uniref:Uma2 family endonuclease n=1 Tax=Methylobacterium durans TaxID=2202825 RepID=A0A2U8W995_9HYPH|nr:Uma2 family endonuclease [Methylobacterium durans]AWN42188.1 Uma2 family endonuclease [Methylobacterium durans]